MTHLAHERAIANGNGDEWTRRETEIVKRNWRDKTAVEIAYMLPGRSASSVVGRVNRLGILKRTGKAYDLSDDEIAFITTFHVHVRADNYMKELHAAFEEKFKPRLTVQQLRVARRKVLDRGKLVKPVEPESKKSGKSVRYDTALRNARLAGYCASPECSSKAIGRYCERHAKEVYAQTTLAPRMRSDTSHRSRYF